MTNATTLEGQSPGRERSRGWALVLISIAQLMVVLDVTITNIALPFIGADLGIGRAHLSWVVTGYALAFGGLLLLGGRLGDLYGRRAVFIVGLTVFAVASLLGGIATSGPLLLTARGVQGVGAALASPAALALITTTFPAGPERSRAFAVYAAMSGAGAAVGLILGGWLTGLDSIFGFEVSGWRLTFLINVPIGVIAAAMAARILEEGEPHPGALDIPGAVTGTIGLLGIVFGLTRAGEAAHGWSDSWTVAALASGVVLLAAFALIESRAPHPLLPIRIFQSRTRAASFVVMMLVPAAMFVMFFFLSLFIQQVVGYTSLRTGLAFLPFSIGTVVSAAISSRLMGRIDARFIAGTGSLLAALALLGFSRLSVDESSANLIQAVLPGGAPVGEDLNYWSSIFPYLLLMSAGMGFVFVPLTLTAVHHVRPEDSGIGSGVLSTMQQVGGMLGLAALNTVSLHFSSDRSSQLAPSLVAEAEEQGLPHVMSPSKIDQLLVGATQLGAFTDGATAAFLVGGGMALLGSLVAWIFLDVKTTELASDGPVPPGGP